ncbi:MAG: SH3 domain-containing protein [Anaerolineaceae bacterium]|nr:SH3 domain-containing protein [Anaerolineaceae bacterium]
MSDDFDDLRSLFDDEEDEDDLTQSDSLPDWESENDSPRMDTGELSGRLGLTGQLGELDWQQTAEGDTLESGADESPFDFDWQGDVSADASESGASGSGLTGQLGELDWQQTSAPEADSAEESDAWMQVFGAEDSEISSPDDSIQDAIPDWMADDNQAAVPDMPDIPDWLQVPTDDDIQPPEDIPDWLQDELDEVEATHPESPEGWQPEEPAITGVEDWLAGLGDLDAPAGMPDTGGDDFMSMFGGDEEDAGEAWFADETPAEPANELPGWLTELEDIGADSVADDMPLPAEEDFLAEIRDEMGVMSDEDTAEPLQDIDSLLANYDSATAQVPTTDEGMLDFNPDIERLLSDEDAFGFEEETGPVQSPEGLVAELPDWLSEMGASVDELSAAAMLRKSKKDRPIEELDERLQALHEEGVNLTDTADEGASALFKNLLPGVNEVLPAAPIVHAGDTGIAGGLILTDQQKQKISQLEKMVSAGWTTSPSVGEMTAIDRTLDSPQDILGDADTGDFAETITSEAVEVRPRRRARRIKLDRLFVTLVILIGVVLPFFVGGLRIGDLPPSAFLASIPAGRAFQQVENLRVGDYVLVAVEYGPTAAAELDSLTDALLRHIIERGAHPVIISGNAVGLLHAGNIMTRIADEQGLQADRDYAITRYLPAGVIGTRAFAGNIAAYLTTDINGQATDLSLTALSDFSLVAILAERAEDVRAWVEQVAPSARGVPLIAGVSYAAAPLAEPYVLQGSDAVLPGLAGMLVGYQDAYTYSKALGSAGRPSQILPPTATTPPPTEVPLVEVTPEVTEPVETPTPLPPTATPTETLIPTETPVPLTATPTLTPTETFTPTPTLTETPRFPASFTPAPSSTPDTSAGGAGDVPVITGVINTSQGVNVRENPGREFAVVAILPGRAVVQITGRNGDESWYKILLEDGTEGWISASLVTIQAPATPTPESAGKRLPAALRLQVGSPTPEGGNALAEATAEATELVVVAPTSMADNEMALPVTTAYQDERWYSMTFGIIVIVAVITLGAVVNILRSLVTRRGRS